jgi:methyltransferase-like protein
MSSENVWEKRYRRAPECAFREIDGEVFVVSSKTGGVHLLNPVGTYIWSLLDGARTLDEIAGAVVEEFDTGAEAARPDILEFIEKLRAAEIIIIG